MKKLFDMKEWLTIEETAQHLSILFNESITEADVLRLGLDGRLTLSVNFVNHAKGRIGHKVELENAKMWVMSKGEFPPRVSAKDVLLSEVENLPEEIRYGLDDGSLNLSPMGDMIGEDEVLQYTDEIINLLRDSLEDWI